MSAGQATPASEGNGAQGAELVFGTREDETAPFSANRHAFHTAIHGILSERMEAMNRNNVETLARLNKASHTPVAIPWDEDEWDAALERYQAEHEWIGIDQRVRALLLCSLNETPTREDVLELAPAVVSSDFEHAQVTRIEAIVDVVNQAAAGMFWLATQTLFDSEEGMDWRIVALVDVRTSNEANHVALATAIVGPRQGPTLRLGSLAFAVHQSPAGGAQGSRRDPGPGTTERRSHARPPDTTILQVRRRSATAPM